MKLDWTARGWTRVYALTVLGTVFCIAVAFAFDSYSLVTSTWRWGTNPLNNLIIPLLLAPTFLFILLNKMRQLAIAHQELMEVAATDGLTSLLNRRAFTEIVNGWLKRIEGVDEASPGALLIIDVDHFKSVNDSFGHDCGDEALKLIADTISDNVRETDLVGRVGGEEFAVFMAGLPQKRIMAVAERIRISVHEAEFTARGRNYQLSVSIGGITFDHSVPFSDLYRGADEKLYSAKREGRDRVELCAA